VFLCGKAGFTEHLEHKAAALSQLIGGVADGHCMSPDYIGFTTPNGKNCTLVRREIAKE
jgi:hypothetical protein